MQTAKLITQPGPEPPVERLLEETADLVEAVPLYGPPAILIVAPLVLLALMVAGPFLAMLTLVAVVLVTTALVALAGAVLASPFLLIRHLRRPRATARMPLGVRLAPIHPRRAAA
jgi:hypothetical protein